MSRNIININSDDFVLLANRLERIGRAELPVVVRSTLNEMAFKMKGSGGKRGQIDKRAEQDFDYRRNRTLFKVLTGVDKAKGLDIGKMKSESGIIEKSGLTKVAEGLADQQTGGTTPQKATPLTGSRTGRSVSKRVRKPSRLQNLNSMDLRHRRKGRFIASADRAFVTNRTVIISGRGGTGIVARIRRINRSERGKVKIRMDWLYRLNDNGQVALKTKRPFVNRAAQEVMKSMPNEFIRQANKRIQKAMKK